MRLSQIIEAARACSDPDPIIAIEGEYGQPIDVTDADVSIVAGPRGVASFVTLSIDWSELEL